MNHLIKLFANFKLYCNPRNSIFNIEKKRFLFNHSRNLKLFNKKFDKMIMIRFENDNKVNISVKCQLTPTSEREFNLNRNKDEPIGTTFNKLFTNYTKQLSNKNKSNKKLKKEEFTDPTNVLSMKQVVITEPVGENVPISLYDLEKKLVPMDTKNEDAWKENFTFKINDQEFKVLVNLPYVKKISLSKLLIAGYPCIVKTEFEPENISELIDENSKYFWYFSQNKFEEQNTDNKKKQVFNIENIEWNLMELENNGQNVKSCQLGDDYQNRLIKVVCVPNDGKRDGIAVEHISPTTAIERIDINKLPMTERHRETNFYLDSKNIRVMSYNILANCYADTALAREELFKYCPSDYLDFKYRRVLLIHEIKNYKSDIMFLQECDSDFYEEDLKATFLSDYVIKFKSKGESKEGECILFRKKRFNFIKSHDISIANELANNPIFEKLVKNLSIIPDTITYKSTISETKELILGRNTILQVVQVESKDKPGHHFLLANTHLFFHPSADFIRLLQSIVCGKYLEKLKHELLKENKDIKEISILFAGDFNSDPPSHAFTYLFTQSVPINNLNQYEKSVFKDCEEDFINSVNLSVYASFPFTNYTQGFHGVLDYVFYESNAFELKKIIRFNEEKYKEKYMPSQFIPSDHVAILFELLIK